MVSVLEDGTWSYEQDTVMIIQGRAEPFHHLDTNVLAKVGEATPNPLASEAMKSRHYDGFSGWINFYDLSWLRFSLSNFF
jgi:hypothetical protein